MISQPLPPGPARRRLPPPCRLTLALGLGLALSASASPTSQRPADLGGPPPVCRVGYLGFEERYGLKGLPVAIRQAVALQDENALVFLRERLTELIGADEAVALQVVAWAEGATGEPELSLFTHALRQSEAVRAPAVVSRLMALAEGGPSAQHQISALEALETQHRLEPELLGRLTTLAKQETRVPGVARHAVRAIGRVMANDFERTGRFEPYMARLLEVAKASPETPVRELAVEMPTYLDARLDGASVAALAALMKGDPNRGVREMAALALSSGRDTQAVLEHFREAFPTEQNECVRWALVRYAVRAGGARALPLLREFAREDRRFQRDAEEFQALYEAGHVDFNHVWMNKRVHHARCEEPEE